MKRVVKANLPIIILLFAVVVYFTVLCHTCQHKSIAEVGDAQEYIQSAENMVNHHQFYCGDLSDSVKPELFSRRLFFYPAVIAFFLYIFNNHYLILGLQIFLSFFNAFLIVRILSEIRINATWIWMSAALFLFYPSQVIFTNIIMTEILLQTFLLSAFFFYMRYIRERMHKDLLFYNVMLVCAVATKPMMLYFWIPNLLIHLWLFAKFRKKLILIFPVLLILMISLWSYRNYKVTGVYHFSSIKNHNLLNYNLRSLLVQKHGDPYANRVISEIEEAAEAEGSYPEAYRYIQSEIHELLSENALLYSSHHLKGLLNYFLDPGRFELYSFFNIENSVSLFNFYNQHGYSGIYRYLSKAPKHILILIVAAGIINLALFASFLYFMFSRNITNAEFKILLITICLYVAFVTGPIGASRFRLPIFPFLILAFALCWGSGSDKRAIFSFPKTRVLC